MSHNRSGLLIVCVSKRRPARILTFLSLDDLPLQNFPLQILNVVPGEERKHSLYEPVLGFRFPPKNLLLLHQMNLQSQLFDEALDENKILQVAAEAIGLF